MTGLIQPPVRTQPAIVVTGPPGAGKSTLGASLSQRIPAMLIDIDTLTVDLTMVVAELLGVDDLDDPRLAAATRVPRYDCMLRVAEENLRLGHAVVLVAPFTRERTDAASWGQVADRLHAAGGVPRLIWLELDPPTLLERMRARGAERDAPKLADMARTMGIDVSAPTAPHVRLDASRPISELVHDVLTELS